MKKLIIVILGALVISSLLVIGCLRLPDTDVTSSPKYNFSSLAGTVWKTKIKVALADVKLYTGRHVTYLLPPEDLYAKYRSPDDTQVIRFLPVGTHLRIERLMKVNGIWSFVFITGSLEDGKVVHVSPYLLAKNRFTFPGSSDSKEWGVNPDLLEKAE